ncbi:MAG: EMC3/TMCO1 family protein [Candidatus Bathyarchaeia archaeon]
MRWRDYNLDPLWEWLAAPPGSTLLILGVSALLSLSISLLRRLFTPKQDINELRAWQKEVAEWEAESKRAKRIGDKRLLRKVKKQEKRIRQLQSKIASQSLGQIKLIPISMLLFFLTWLALTGNLLGWQVINPPPPFAYGVVAWLPWFGSPLPLYLFQWYVLCSLATSIIITRLFGQQMGASE